ncbi:tetratricopeptide repeat protein [Thalassotalea piscium]
MKTLWISLLVLSLGYVAPVTIDEVGSARASEKQASEVKSVRVPAMRNRVYTQFARAQQIADTGDNAGGLAVLDQVKEQLDNLNSYEKAMLWNFYAFMHYANDDMTAAIQSFENVVAEEAIPETLRLSTLYSLAQLSMQQQNYTQTLTYLSQWQAANTKPLTSAQHMLFAQVYYQNKQYPDSLASVNEAVALAKVDDKLPKENWLILQRANYYELKQPKDVTRVMEQLVKYYSKPDYWIQLGAMYGEIGAEDKQLAIMEAAHQAGYVTKKQDILSLAQLYRYHDVPFKAAQLLSESIENGKIAPSERHLEMLAQAYVAAKSFEQALPVLKKASEIAENGKYDMQLAQSYLNLEQWQNAINAADKALERGGIDRVGDMHLVLGMALFNLQKFDESLLAFKAAENIKSSAKTAKQWYQYVKREQGQYEQLAMLQ